MDFLYKKKKVKEINCTKYNNIITFYKNKKLSNYFNKI